MLSLLLLLGPTSTDTLHPGPAPSSSERPVILVSKETRNQNQWTYLMGSSAQFSNPHFMGFDFPLSKGMTNVKSVWCKAMGPGRHLGTLTVLSEPRLLKCPGLVFLIPRWTWVKAPPPLLVQTLEILWLTQRCISLYTAPFQIKT